MKIMNDDFNHEVLNEEFLDDNEIKIEDSGKKRDVFEENGLVSWTTSSSLSSA